MVPFSCGSFWVVSGDRCHLCYCQWSISMNMGASLLGMYQAAEVLRSQVQTCSAFRDTAHKEGSFFVN